MIIRPMNDDSGSRSSCNSYLHNNLFTRATGYRFLVHNHNHRLVHHTPSNCNTIPLRQPRIRRRSAARRKWLKGEWRNWHTSSNGEEPHSTGSLEREKTFSNFYPHGILNTCKTFAVNITRSNNFSQLFDDNEPALGWSRIRFYHMFEYIYGQVTSGPS